MADENKAQSIMLGAGIVILVIAVLGLGMFFSIRQYIVDHPGILDQQVQNNQQDENQSSQTDQTVSWTTLSAGGLSFKYPANFFDLSQQPKILVGDCNTAVFPGQCPDISQVLSQDKNIAGNYQPGTNGTSKIKVNGVDYCKTQIQDSAAGHSYQYYYYTTVSSKKCVVAYLATSQTHCENYLPLEAGNTDQQQNYNDCVAKNTNQPTVLQQIANSFTLTQ
jgi:hypothetical protein